MGNFLIGLGIYALGTIIICFYLIKLAFKKDKDDLAVLIFPIWLFLSLIVFGIILKN